MEDMKVYEIKRKGKYIIQAPSYMTHQQIMEIRTQLIEWLHSDETFIFMTGDIKLMKILESDQISKSPLSS